MLNLTYYTRDNCHLCNEGKLQIRLALSELRDNVVKLRIYGAHPRFKRWRQRDSGRRSRFCNYI